jgi:hypothetical protein
MKNHHRTIGVVLAVLLGIATSDLRAQENDRVGTSGLVELTVPVTPRTISLGSALTGGMAGASGVEALIANPAAASLNPSTNAMFSRMNYVADVGVNYFGIAQRFGANNIGLAVTSWDYGDIPEQTVDQPEINPDNTWSAATYVVGLTYARELTDRIGAGVTVKGMSQRIDNMDARTFALDAGMTYVVGESGLRLGVSLRNFGPQVNYSGIGLQESVGTGGPGGDFDVPAEVQDISSELPSMLNFGITYERTLSSQLSATALANFRSNSYDVNQYAAGLQLGFQDIVFLRGGLDLASESDMVHWSEYNFGAGLALPIGSSRLTIDYAYRPSDVFDGVNIIAGSFTL